ncbi:MAG TPA: winged helix-turn-helix domain-containing protein, partial [Gemmatimonadales bacterium]|nr:winged helix-turn-helix domain-containing protein [Gemmatimonadales bacterium]
MEARQQSLCVIRFGDFEVDQRAGELRRHGTKVKLQQQPFRVLVRLLERPGELVTREELREAIWAPGTFAEFDGGLDATIHKLRSALGDSAEHPRFVETLPRRGYRFIGGAVEVVTPKARAQHRWVRRWPIVLTAGLTGLIALGLAAKFVLRDRLSSRGIAERIQSIAVLPLRDLSGDSAQAYFAAGMTEALVTRLGKTSGLRVISLTSAMSYQGTRVTLPTIARQLNVDAVVEGAVLREGNRVRVTAQLVEASSDRHVWAETYEGGLQDVLELQDEIARAITTEVLARVSAPAGGTLSSNRARPVNPDAYDLYLKGRYEWNDWTEQGLKRSIEYFEQAVQKDPSYAPAW